MKKLFKAAFSRDKTEVRDALNHPRELQPGDFLKIDDSLLLPELLRDQSLQVQAVNTYQYEYRSEPEWVLKSAWDIPLFFSIDSEDGADTACFSVKITPDVVEILFDLDEFSEIFGESGLAELTTAEVPDELEHWVATTYRQTNAGQRGYHYEEDFRGGQPPSDEGSGEPFDYYCLQSNDLQQAIEIEVWPDGDTDVMLTIYRPMSDIRELWPAQKTDSR